MGAAYENEGECGGASYVVMRRWPFMSFFDSVLVLVLLDDIRFRVLIVGLVCGLVGTVGFGLAASVPMFAAMRAVQGLAFALVTVRTHRSTHNTMTMPVITSCRIWWVPMFAAMRAVQVRARHGTHTHKHTRPCVFFSS
jgi:MFS family permease